MDVPAGVLVKRHGLKQNVVAVAAGSLSNLLRKIDDLVDELTDFESVRVHGLANLALELLPVEGPNVHVGSRERLFLLLCQHPALEAVKVDKSY